MTFQAKRFLLIAALIFASGCSNDRSVRLSLDFSKQAAWRYSLNADVHGSIVSADTQRTFSSSARCTLAATPDPKTPGLLHATVSSLSIASDILGSAEVENLRAQARGIRMNCALNDGIIMPEDSSSMPLVRIGEWDLYKDLAKTLPALPKTRIHVGASWDRERAIPLETQHGSATGHLYQSFSLDSIYPGNAGASYALVRWTFTYMVEIKKAGPSGLLDAMPTRGSGKGSAIVNITGKTLDRAAVTFDVPAASEGAFKISWNETIELSLVK